MVKPREQLAEEEQVREEEDLQDHGNQCGKLDEDCHESEGGEGDQSNQWVSV